MSKQKTCIFMSIGYTYAYDDAKGLAKCGAQTQFELVFCPQARTEQQKVMMTLVFPATTAPWTFNGASVGFGQSIAILNGDKLSFQNNDCTLAVDENGLVAGVNGALCAQLRIDNEREQIEYSEQIVPSRTYKIQINYNTAFGITALLNERQVSNAEVTDASQLPETTLLQAIQGNREAECSLTLASQSITAGGGELCQRLNIVKDGSDKFHVYLPADIPDMAGFKPIIPEHYLTFGMSSSMFVNLDNHTYTNGMRVNLKDLPSGQMTLLAIQNQLQAQCDINQQGGTLMLMLNSGTLCDHGLTLVKEANGDYYIGLPSTLPKIDAGERAFELGIAQGMIIQANGQGIAWNMPNKALKLPQGLSSIRITGNNGSIKICPVNLSNDMLTIQQNSGCLGVVKQGNVIYFPYF